MASLLSSPKSEVIDLTESPEVTEVTPRSPPPKFDTQELKSLLNSLPSFLNKSNATDYQGPGQRVISTIPQNMGQPRDMMKTIGVGVAMTNTTPGMKTYGPPGSNLFIFHAPREWSERDLRECFGGFGTILSCRVGRDTAGNPRGYCFVSYDCPEAAAAAITHMNDLRVRGKRLAVMLKKGDPYAASTRLEMEQKAARGPYSDRLSAKDSHISSPASTAGSSPRPLHTSTANPARWPVYEL